MTAKKVKEKVSGRKGIKNQNIFDDARGVTQISRRVRWKVDKRWVGPCRRIRGPSKGTKEGSNSNNQNLGEKEIWMTSDVSATARRRTSPPKDSIPKYTRDVGGHRI